MSRRRGGRPGCWPGPPPSTISPYAMDREDRFPATHPDYRFGAPFLLAERLGLPYDANDQDWEYTVEVPLLYERILAAYASGALTDEERVSAGMVLVEAVANDTPHDGTLSDRWPTVEAVLRSDLRLHAATISYWMNMDDNYHRTVESSSYGIVGARMRTLWPETARTVVPPVGK